ncbi:MAG: two-component system chemotaxis response regulator CheY [Kiritimatiellia bacterium]
MKILVVDDSRAMRMIVKRTLRQAGFNNLEVDEAENGVVALASIKSNSPQLVLCDWNMPEMNGIELLRELRASGNVVNFGFVTSEASPEMKNTASAAGAQFLITKPFNADTFKSVLAHFIR